MLSFVKSAGTGLNLPTYILSILVFKFTKFVFSANLEVSIPVAFLKSNFVAELDKSALTLMLPSKDSCGLRKCWMSFLSI